MRALALCCLILAAPVLALCCMAVWIDSPGSPIFRQTRVGKNRRPFTCWKLRTMCVEAESRLPEVWHLNDSRGPFFKSRNDPRVTRVGRWLRRLSIDELPQLWNVTRGEMALVGPRPLKPGEAAGICGAHARRFDVLPGITGLWQVEGRLTVVPPEQRMHLDAVYAALRTRALDAKIIRRTFRVLFRGV